MNISAKKYLVFNGIPEFKRNTLKVTCDKLNAIQVVRNKCLLCQSKTVKFNSRATSYATMLKTSWKNIRRVVKLIVNSFEINVKF